MNVRLAGMDDLPQLKEVYKKIVDNMNQNHIQIWDEIYPCEFFEADIKNNCLYVLEENNEIASAFALSDSNAGTNYVKWKDRNAKAFYLDRFGVNVKYSRKGIGSMMLHKAIETAGKKGAGYLRLFVVDINEPAIKLYLKNGFKKADGIYEERIDDELVLRELGFEIETE